MGLYCDSGDVTTQLASLPLTKLRESLSNEGHTLEDYIDDDLLPGVELDIAQACGRAFNSVSRRYVVSGSGWPKLFVPTRPVIAATAVRLNIIPSVQWYTFTSPCYENVYDETQTEIREPTDHDAYGEADVIVNVAEGSLVIPPRIAHLALAGAPFFTYTWIQTHEAVPNIELEVTTGYATIPADVKLACARMAALLVLPDIDAAETRGVRSWRIGDESRTWGGNTVPQSPGSNGIWDRYQYTGLYHEKGRQFQHYAAHVLKTRRMMR